jgi:hypothetical protein
VTQAQPTEPLVLNDASFFVAGKKYNIINITNTSFISFGQAASEEKLF